VWEMVHGDSIFGLRRGHFSSLDCFLQLCFTPALGFCFCPDDAWGWRICWATTHASLVFLSKRTWAGMLGNTHHMLTEWIGVNARWYFQMWRNTCCRHVRTCRMNIGLYMSRVRHIHTNKCL
jgi:hypothetical protein